MSVRTKTLNQAAAALHTGQFDETIRLCQKLLRQRNADIQAHKLLAHALLRKGQLEATAATAQRLTDLAPGDPDAWVLLARAQMLSGKIDLAEANLRQAIAKAPRHAQSWHELGMALRLQQKNDAAREAFAHAQSLAPREPNYSYNYSLALIETGQANTAEQLCRAAIAQGHNQPALLHALGLALLALDQREAALDQLARAHELAHGNSAILADLGSCTASLGDYSNGIQLMQKALALNPSAIVVHTNLIKALAESRRAGEALSAMRQLAQLPGQQDYASLRVESIRRLIAVGRQGAAAALLEEAQSEDPHDQALTALSGFQQLSAREYAKAERTFLQLVEDGYDLAALTSWLSRLLVELGPQLHPKIDQILTGDDRPGAENAADNILLAMNISDQIGKEQAFQAHCEWAARHTANLQMPPLPVANPASADKKLRIGYVSPDFRAHSVAYFIEPLLELHDRTQVEVFCYYSGSRTDEVTERLRERADGWRPIEHLTDEQALQMVRGDAIDILVDLAGHTDKNRLGLFALHPSPVQVTWLGYPNTTGLEAIDYRLCDAVSDPPGDDDRYYTETLWRLPRGFLCYRGLPLEPGQGRNDDSDHITFGSFNNLYKITDTTLCIWGRILEELPTARLVVKAHQLTDEEIAERFRRRMVKFGLRPEQVELLGHLKDREEHLRLYDRIDIALDSHPYNGTTTTCEALWMGVPVITMRGDRHAARVGASIMSHAGLPELIAETPDEYVAKALDLAGDRSRLQTYHVGLRDILSGSQLCDAAGFAGQVEAAYRQMWREYVARARPA